jgi:hypothetical protein
MSDELSVPSRVDNFDQFRQVLVGHGGPAFLRRAAEVNSAYERLLDSCRQQRKEMLAIVGLRLETLHALAGNWNALRPLIAEQSQLVALTLLHDELNPQLRCPVLPTNSERVLRRALAHLIESTENFNQRWLDYLRSIDLSAINRLREGYNRYYVLEKECAVRSASLARIGFRALEMLEWEHLLAVLPLVPVPSPWE